MVGDVLSRRVQTVLIISFCHFSYNAYQSLTILDIAAIYPITTLTALRHHLIVILGCKYRLMRLNANWGFSCCLIVYLLIYPSLIVLAGIWYLVIQHQLIIRKFFNNSNCSAFLRIWAFFLLMFWLNTLSLL